MLRSVVFLMALAGPAGAQEFQQMPGVEYYCTGSGGERYELGAIICITASCQTWTARCDMSLNIPMWRKTQDGCPAVSLPVTERLARLRG